MSTSFTMLKPLADGWCHGIYPFKIMPCLLLFPFQISAVRAVVPNKSNNEIVLVLQHFENCVDKAVHAFLEGMNGTTICATMLWPVVIVGQMSLGCILLTWNVPTTLQSWCRTLYIYILMCIYDQAYRILSYQICCWKLRPPFKSDLLLDSWWRWTWQTIVVVGSRTF